MKQNELKVLIVDDEIAFANTLAQRLIMRNMKADTAYNGEQALSEVNSEKPDVVVLDLNMPGMHGMEVLQKIKESYPSIQVIVLTGHGTEKDADEARRLGGFDFLNKPVDIDTLAQKIKSAWRMKLV
jgi:DNA-binding NtrC family response regulator